jgi:hypothetical protein
MDRDENGWAVGAIVPMSIDAAWSLITPEAEARIEAARWEHQASAFFGARIALAFEKKYPAGTTPRSDVALIDVTASKVSARYRTPDAEPAKPTRVTVVTVPIDRAEAVARAAREGALAIGGAGFDVLVARGRRVWQVADEVDAGGDPRAPLVVAAVIASVVLAPIVPPRGGTIFGVKGARERLAERGWA